MRGTASASGIATAAYDVVVRSASVRHQSSALVSSACGCLKSTAEQLCCFSGVMTTDQLSTCRPGDTVLDVGANIGIFSLWASERVGPSGRVVAVEPLPPIFDALVHNVAAHVEWCHGTGMPRCRGS